MKLVIAAILVGSAFGALAWADKSFTGDKTATWDCAKDATVTIMHGNGKYTFKGACKDITVNGGHNALTIEHVATLTLNGSSNKVAAGNLDAVNITGSDNKVTWKRSGGTGGKPTVSTLGQNNAITAGK
ncbi:MAG: DUF3060 domain-containing protein [Kofleriaceae bacterium]